MRYIGIPIRMLHSTVVELVFYGITFARVHDEFPLFFAFLFFFLCCYGWEKIPLSVFCLSVSTPDEFILGFTFLFLFYLYSSTHNRLEKNPGVKKKKKKSDFSFLFFFFRRK